MEAMACPLPKTSRWDPGGIVRLGVILPTDSCGPHAFPRLLGTSLPWRTAANFWRVLSIWFVYWGRGFDLDCLDCQAGKAAACTHASQRARWMVFSLNPHCGLRRRDP